MEESHIWLSRLLRRAQDSQLQGQMSDGQFQQTLLYVLAAQMIDWDSPKWTQEREAKYWVYHDTPQANVHMLMEHCRHPSMSTTCDEQTYEQLSALMDEVTEELDGEECLDLFDSLFYHIVTQGRFDRRHAQISGALAAGLAHVEGLIDIAPYSGEAFIKHFELYQYRFDYKLVERHSPLQHLTQLRLVVQGVDAELIQLDPRHFKRTELSVLDNPSFLKRPFSTLLQLLEARTTIGPTMTGRTLVVFRSGSTDDPKALEALKQHLSDRDLLEAVFDFISYNDAGKSSRHCAWLLNDEKTLPGQTLCIDTRQLLEVTRGVTSEELACFAAGIYQVWRSNGALNSSRYPQSKQLGSLQGLFARWFDDGYSPIDGICMQLETREVLKSGISARRVKRKDHERDVSLLDRRPLEHLLGQSDHLSACIYVIGNNGAGKSLLLSSLVNHLKQQSISSVAIVIGPIDRFPLADREKYPDYRYLGDRTSTGYSSQTIERKLIDLLIETVGIPERLTLLESVLERLGLKQRLYLAPKGAFNELLQPLDLAAQVISLAAAVHSNVSIKGLTLALSRQGSSTLLKFTDLSSGEQQVLVLFAKITASAGPGKVLLIDEPEVSLHVGWQQLLPSLFSLMAQQLQTRFVIATHSPTLVANAKDNLSHCFMAKDSQLTEIAPAQRHSVETILLKGFETYTPHNREVAERCAALVTEAIRTTNRDDTEKYAERQEGFKKALDYMTAIMVSSGNAEDKRFQLDLQLIEQAGRAINETFALAAQEGLA